MSENPFCQRAGRFWNATMTKHRLVYSTDPRDQARKCPRCGWDPADCRCAERAPESIERDYTVIFRMESAGRGGKTVTVLEGWPRNENFLKDMTKELKSKCGVGGTHKIENGKARIEIQGDKRPQLKKILEEKGIKFKGM